MENRLEVEEFEGVWIENACGDRIVLVPDYRSLDGRRLYSEDSISLYKYLAKSVDIVYSEPPARVLVQRSSHWFGPAIQITSEILAKKPEILSVLIAGILSYIRLTKASKIVKLRIFYKNGKKVYRVNYEGNVEGLECIKEKILEIDE